MVKKASKPEKQYRSFTIEGSSIGYNDGAYVSSSPFGAASKAARKLFRLVQTDSKYKHKQHTEVFFLLVETTQGSEHKTFAYRAQLQKLSSPIDYHWMTEAEKQKRIEQNKPYQITDKVVLKSLHPNDVASKCH
jgi:hypothetical protein